jgi:ADP-ribosylglycohydrolase
VAFSYAVYFAIKENDYKKVIEYLISAKGDTDTNACIAGGLLGVKLGLKKHERNDRSNLKKSVNGGLIRN